MRRELNKEKDFEMTVGTIANFYGELIVKKENGKFHWGIENYDGIQWKEIPQKLFDTLVLYEYDRLFAEEKEQV